MKTKDVLLVASGVAIGYLIFKKDLFKKETSVQKVADGASEIATGAKELIVEGVDTIKTTTDSLLGGLKPIKESECEKKWSEQIGSVSRFASKEDKEKSKSNFVKSCMAK
jgi:hypothetical protein